MSARVRDAADPDALADAAALIRAGRLVAFPTETVYGLGADALSSEAVERLFAAKGRPTYNPVIAHVENIAGARELVSEWPDDAAIVAAAFWPGPVTLVLPAGPSVPAIVRAGLPAVGVRVPDHPVALALLRAAGRPIAAPSANRFTEISPTTAAHVARGLGDRVDLILDGGPTTVGIESTVLDLTSGAPRVLRPGAVSTDDLARVLGRPVPIEAGVRGDAPRLSPGMVDRHYAPRADVWLLDAADEAEIVRALHDRADRRAPGAVGAICRTARALPHVDHVIRLHDDAPGFARGLYAALHTLDAEGCAVILLERPPADAAWDGVRDRIDRAAR
jgi:L-threonylcarbamoyladenylate synthase